MRYFLKDEQNKHDGDMDTEWAGRNQSSAAQETFAGIRGRVAPKWENWTGPQRLGDTFGFHTKYNGHAQRRFHQRSDVIKYAIQKDHSGLVH